MADTPEDTTRTLVLAGFSVLALMAVGTLGTILALYFMGRDVPQGLAIIFTGTAGVAVTTFAGLVKDYTSGRKA
jgi:hypothetical protein